MEPLPEISNNYFTEREGVIKVQEVINEISRLSEFGR